MRIRKATALDDDAIIEILKQFADSQPFGRLKVEAKEYNDHYVRKILDAVRNRGIILLATKNKQVLGVFMAIINPDMWIPRVKIMNELVWWVNPEHRNSTAGARLLKEYTKIGEKMVKDKTISTFTMTLLEDSPIKDLQKRGWTPIETNYVYGEQ
jgi:hypothetical protein